MDTTNFLNHYEGLILLSKNSPEVVLRRFMVKTLTLNKLTTTTSQHEYLSIEVYDADLENSKTHLVFLERTAFDVPPDPTTIDRDFANHPDSHLVHDIIQKLSSRFSSLGHSSAPAIPSDEDQMIPLMPITPSSDSLPVAPSPTPSFAGIASLASTQFVHRFSESFVAKTRHAGDRFVVGRRPVYGNGQIMRQLEPNGLTFFHLIVLANTVHQHDPLYSLLKRQCFWYANTIYLVVEALYKCQTAADNIGDEALGDIHIPPEIYLPDSAGRWMGILVTDVSEKVVEIMKRKFEEAYAKVCSKVCFALIAFPSKNIVNF